MAELRPYNPSWRDSIASMLMGDSRASPERARFVEGLVGSRGLGSTGANLADMTPIGMGFAANEYARAQTPVEAMFAAVGLLPAAKPAAVAAKAGGAVARVAGESAPSIRAFHGSPHSFDRFDISKIGTGEGAQAFGHGLYFAENEGVARSYRDALRPGKGVGAADIAARHLSANGDDVEAAIASLRSAIDNAFARNVPYDDVRSLMDAKSVLLGTPEKAKGSMYEVRIKSKPEAFLDWDAPFSQQSQQVKDILGRFGFKDETAALRAYDDALLAALEGRSSAPVPRQPYDPTGAEIYESSKLVPGDYRDSKKAAATLREAGVPGIKYLDRSSRAVDGPQTRNYVVFDDNLVEIMRKYGLMAPIPTGVVGGLAAQPAPDEYK